MNSKKEMLFLSGLIMLPFSLSLMASTAKAAPELANEYVCRAQSVTIYQRIISLAVRGTEQTPAEKECKTRLEKRLKYSRLDDNYTDKNIQDPKYRTFVKDYESKGDALIDISSDVVNTSTEFYLTTDAKKEKIVIDTLNGFQSTSN